MTEERFEEFVKRTLDELDPVPPAPREEMWASIRQQRRFAERAAAQRKYKVWVSWAAGVAATLAVGVGIGRFTATNELNEGERAQVAVAPPASPSLSPSPSPFPSPTRTRSRPSTPSLSGPNVNRTAYRLTVAKHLTSAEALLTSFRTQPRGALDPEIAIWARDLLTNTRLLLDSPAADDPNVAALLEDLELIIAQIARMSAPSKEEAAIIRDGMNKTAVLPRLRATMPAGAAAVGT